MLTHALNKFRHWAINISFPFSQELFSPSFSLVLGVLKQSVTSSARSAWSRLNEAPVNHSAIITVFKQWILPCWANSAPAEIFCSRALECSCLQSSLQTEEEPLSQFPRDQNTAWSEIAHVFFTLQQHLLIPAQDSCDLRCVGGQVNCNTPSCERHAGSGNYYWHWYFQMLIICEVSLQQKGL